MSRYRPPRAASSPYITPEGFARLQAELQHLWQEKRPEVTRKVKEAAAQGDRSENAEYIYGKKQLREIDSRVRFLSKRLEQLEIVDRQPTDKARVFFGAWVTLVDDQGHRSCYRLVGADEFDLSPEYISIDAPLARSLIGRQVGDEVVVDEQAETGMPRVLRPDHVSQQFCYEVEDICWQRPDGADSNQAHRT